MNMSDVNMKVRYLVEGLDADGNVVETQESDLTGDIVIEDVGLLFGIDAVRVSVLEVKTEGGQEQVHLERTAE